MARKRKATQPEPEAEYRPGFLEELNRAYSHRRKNIAILTGDVYGLFWSRTASAFHSIEQLLYRELSGKFNLIHMDIATGLSFFDRSSEAEIIRVCESSDGIYIPRDRMENMRKLIESCRHNPLAALVLLQGMGEAFGRVRREEPNLKPLCLILQFAGALFPPGNFDRLSELDRQRLVFFLNWVTDPRFQQSPELIVLINHVNAEINGKVGALPNAVHLEIKLPASSERQRFVDDFMSHHRGVKFAGGKSDFVEDTAGLTLGHLKDLLEVANRTGQPVTREAVIAEVNRLVQTQLGDIIRLNYPAHSPADIIGYQEAGAIFKDIFARCEDPETAIPALIVSGPNGSGKTFQLEAYASESGRVVIELAGIRGSYFGETDRFFELLRWHIATLGKILILVDEAHTAFGSIHGSDTHQTEKRLSGNIIKMMGNPQYLGKVVWGLMTSRPDLLDPDIKSRAPVQVPIFDLEGEPRRLFLAEMFRRKKLKLVPGELDEILARTEYYSARDYRNLVAEVLAQGRENPDRTALEVLSGWQASKSIIQSREFQELIAALHCSYPKLLPARYRNLSDGELQDRLDQLKYRLQR